MSVAGALTRLSCVAYVAVVALAPLLIAVPAGRRGAAYVALHLALSALMAVAWAAGGRADPRAVRWTLAAGVLSRLILVPCPAYTSHDVDRYLWDGGAALAGVDPYRTAPEDVAPAVAARLGALPDNASYPTIYPPAALAIFAACAALDAEAARLAWKGLVCAASLAALALVARELRARAAERHLPFVALSPLLILEGGVGGHLDLLVAPFVLGALLLSARGQVARAGVAVAVAALLKLWPIAVLPVLVASVLGRGAGRLLGAALATLCAAYAVALLAGLRPIGSLPDFVAGWRFGTPVFPALEATLGGAAALGLAALLATGTVALAALRAADGDAEPGARASLSAPLLWGPVVFPWYLTSVVTVAGLRPSWTLVAWSSAAPLTYEVLDRYDVGLGWAPAAWPLVALAAAVGLAAALDLRSLLWRPAPAAPPVPDLARSWRVTAVVPTLDEAARIEGALRRLPPGIDEVVVVDGGSRDGTAARAAAIEGVRVTTARRGRGPQLRAGAEAATGDVLVFLHADVRLPPDAGAWIRATLAEPRVAAGAFRTWTVRERGAPAWWSPVLRVADVRSRVARLPYGDQALFVRAETLRAVGGYPDLELLEDVEVARRLLARGAVTVVPACVGVSGRRFQARPLATMALTQVLPLLGALGVSRARLAAWYRSADPARDRGAAEPG